MRRAFPAFSISNTTVTATIFRTGPWRAIAGAWPMPEIGVVAALPAEAATWPAGDGFRVVASGPGKQRAADAARRLLDDGVAGLISWGVGGGLKAALRRGALALADRVAAADGQRTPGPAWRRQAASRLRSMHRPVATGSVWTDAHAVTAVADKRRLALDGHDLVDMEAAAVSCVAHEAGVPFLVVKAVCYPAGRALPACAARLLRADGRVRVAALVATLARGPRTWRHLRRVRRDFAAARASLRVAASLLSLS